MTKWQYKYVLVQGDQEAADLLAMLQDGWQILSAAGTADLVHYVMAKEA